MNKDHQLESLIRMANQIADNLTPGASDEADAAAQVANHIRHFWPHSMKAQIVEYAQTNSAELNNIVRLAVTHL